MDKSINTINMPDVLDTQTIRSFNRKYGKAKSDLVLNMSNVKQMDSAGLGLLIKLHRNVSKRGKAVQLFNVPPKVQIFLELTQVDHLFKSSTDTHQMSPMLEA